MTITFSLLFAGLIYLAVCMAWSIIRPKEKQSVRPTPRKSSTCVPPDWDGTTFNNFSNNLFKQIKQL